MSFVYLNGPVSDINAKLADLLLELSSDNRTLLLGLASGLSPVLRVIEPSTIDAGAVWDINYSKSLLADLESLKQVIMINPVLINDYARKVFISRNTSHIPSLEQTFAGFVVRSTSSLDLNEDGRTEHQLCILDAIGILSNTRKNRVITDLPLSEDYIRSKLIQEAVYSSRVNSDRCVTDTELRHYISLYLSVATRILDIDKRADTDAWDYMVTELFIDELLSDHNVSDSSVLEILGGLQWKQ